MHEPSPLERRLAEEGVHGIVEPIYRACLVDKDEHPILCEVFDTREAAEAWLAADDDDDSSL